MASGFEGTLIVLMIILAFALIIPEFFRKLRIPFVSSLIIVGAIIGPHGLGYLEVNEIIGFFGFLGMSFLMFMAGLEANLERLKKLKSKVFIMVGVIGSITFLTGFFIGMIFGYDFTTNFILGIIFISSSIAIVISALESAGILHRDSGQLIVSSILTLDILSLLMLSFFLRSESPIFEFPPYFYVFLIPLFILGVFIFIPRFTKFGLVKEFNRNKKYESKVRFVIFVVFGILVLFSLLGMHPLFGAFIAGLCLSGIIKHKKLYDQLHTLGYGLFIPTFFVIVGMEMDLSILMRFDVTNIIMVSLVSGLILSKSIGGYLGGRLAKLSKRNSTIFGIAATIQMTTTLAVTYAAFSEGLLDNVLITSILVLSIITTILGPIILGLFNPKKI